VSPQHVVTGKPNCDRVKRLGIGAGVVCSLASLRASPFLREKLSRKPENSGNNELESWRKSMTKKEVQGDDSKVPKPTGRGQRFATAE